VIPGPLPGVPVSGEMHYSRVPRERWAERLRQMRAGGLTMVTSYVFWLHHVERQGVARFDGDLDVAAFADACADAGLDLILRIGPWCHGEARNGGFPDWVQEAPVRHRTDDPAYLGLVREWFGQLGAALDGRRPLGIQLENELYDQPGHLVTLKRLAREAGLDAPIWVATAWGSADLPAEEVWPLWGGYGDGFWVDADAPWDPTFRQHYFFSHVWDDPGIGADLRRTAAAAARTPSTVFPPATCELGGGMATAYHRRPRPSGLDVATPAHCKIGNGSAWQGYYMYAGGTNPAGRDGMQESHATGYPNDLQRRGYDFHAAIGEAGTIGPPHAPLRQQHAFLAAFGDRLASPSRLPEVMPDGVEDVSTLRWAVRGGFLFIAWHQPHVPLDTFRGAQFEVDDLLLPSRPFDIPPGTLARWPLGLTIAGTTLDYATASALTLLPGPRPTLVLTASAGIDVEIRVAGSEPMALPVGVTPLATFDVLVLSPAEAVQAWVCDGRLLLSAAELSWFPLAARGLSPSVQVFEDRSFRPLALTGPAGRVSDVSLVPDRAASVVPIGYGKHDGRQSAPTPAVFDSLAAVYRVPLPGWAAEPSLDALLDIDWAGDIAELRVDGRTATDRFWDGSRWTVNLRDAGCRAGSIVTLHVLPLATGSTVGLPEDARERLLAADGQLLAVDRVRVRAHPAWVEA
jgi:beta-galactosidase